MLASMTQYALYCYIFDIFWEKNRGGAAAVRLASYKPRLRRVKIYKKLHPSDEIFLIFCKAFPRWRSVSKTVKIYFE